MRVRNNRMVGALLATAALFAAHPALAQGPAQAATPAAVPSASTSESLFSPPSVLGEAWARALRAVIDDMKQSVDAEHLEAAQAVGAPIAPIATPRPKVARFWIRGLTPAHSAWLPAHALRDAIAESPVQLTPVAVAPPTESGVDTRGEHAVLLGAKVDFPWLVP